MTQWQPTTTHEFRVARAALLKQIRTFFEQREVLEVETPLLSNATVTDQYIDAFETHFDYSSTGKTLPLYLQTSPEYAMKRLLCAQSGAIYQIGKAFRHEGEGRWHNPEFTMLEWYRPGFDHHKLMDEVDALLMACLQTQTSERISYQDAFIKFIHIDPLVATDIQLETAMEKRGINIENASSLDKDTKLQLLFGVAVEPRIGQNVPCFIYHFPASQAALAKINPSDSRTAERFEVYFKGAELANGFHELSNAQEQRERFLDDNNKRRKSGLVERPIDDNLLAALASGLPNCAGVAMGIDRLLMIKTGASHIQDVINFTVSRA